MPRTMIYVVILILSIPSGLLLCVSPSFYTESCSSLGKQNSPMPRTKNRSFCYESCADSKTCVIENSLCPPTLSVFSFSLFFDKVDILRASTKPCPTNRAQARLLLWSRCLNLSTLPFFCISFLFVSSAVQRESRKHCTTDMRGFQYRITASTDVLIVRLCVVCVHIVLFIFLSSTSGNR